MWQLLILSLLISTKPGEGKLTVTIQNLRNAKGAVLLTLYNKGEGFPRSTDKAYKREKVTIQNGVATVVFDQLPPGKYAIAVMHDENNNLNMDFNFVGIPKEGFGFSNNARAPFGPPSFSKASFAHDGPQQIAIRMRYF